MGSRQEFDLTERLIQPNMTDEETAKYWQAKNAKVVFNLLDVADFLSQTIKTF